MNAPTCLWSPMDGQALQQEMRQWRRPAQISSDREQRSEPQGRYAADVMDSFRMNLRQAKHALVTRDEEARKLRLAVTHLEGVLSLRERELQDTVSCLHGKSVPRPHQEWLQPGTSNSRLRLQVHRLQRALTAKQDHIEHLNRQASLGFLREAREQADEYRIEAARLSRALAAATGGAGRRGQFATRTPVDCLLSSASRGAGAASTTLGFRVEESKNQGARASQEPDLSGALYTRVPQFRSQNMSRSAPRCDVRRDAHQQQRSSDGSYGGRKVSPALDAEAAIQAYLGGHGAVGEREMPPAPCLSPPSTTLDDVTGLLFEPPPPRNNDGVYGLIHSGRRPTSSRRSAGRASARAGYGRFLGWSASPDRCRAFSEEKRLSCMAASARLRSAVRRSALEYNDVLALSEESRRLQMARAERARRARMARQRIARYREERIRELERRLERHCGMQSAHTAPATDTAEPPGAQQHEGKRTGKGRYGHESGGEDTNTSAAIGTTDGGKLQRLSEARREIDAAIATAMEEKYGPAIAHHEPTGSAKTEIKDSQDGDFVNRQRQWRRSSSGTGSVTAEEDPVGRGAREDTHDLRKRQSGKPPLAPSHPGRRRRPRSALRRHSSVSEVVESEDASSDDEIGGDYHVREVQTEVVGNGGDDGGWEDRWHDQHLPDEEESVQEEIIPARGWGEDERGGAPVDGVPPTLSKVGNERARRRLNDDHKRRRNPHYERNNEAIGENNDKREEGVPALDAVCEDVNGRDYLGSGRTKLTTRKSLPIAERRDRRSSSRNDELDLRREGADVGGLFDKNTKPRARKREGGGCSNDSRQDSAGSSVEGAPNNLRSRGRRRRRRDEGGKVRIDSGRFDDPVPSHGHTLKATIGATVASEIREETDIVDGGVEDDGDSCSSRWSLSAENEPQERQSADSASPTRQAQHVVGGGSGGSSPTRIANPDGERDRHDRQRKVPVEPEFEDGATFSGSGNHAGGIIPEYTDDFSEESQRRDQGFDVVYGVSSPSDEEHEAFAEAKADCDTQVRNAHQRGRLQPPFDTNTASNQRMINGPPFEQPTTDTRQDDGSSVGGNERTGRLRPDNNSSDENQGLLQPVSPPVLRHSVQTAEFGAALAEGSFPEREQQARRTQPSGKEPVATKVDDKAGTNNLSSANSVGQASTLRSHDTLNAGQSEMESGSEANDLVASLKIDSAALFASLSASTAGVSLSSKSMARPEESFVNVQGVAAPARQPGGSTSTFALSADDGDDAGATHVEGDDATATKSSSARIEMESASIAGNSRGLDGDEPKEEDSSTVRRQVAPPTSVSPTSSLERGDDGTTTVPEIGDRLDSLPVVEQQQTSSSREVSSGAPHRNGVILPTQQVYDTATASVTELAASPMGDRTTLLLGDEEAEQPQVQDHPDLEDIARRQDEEEGANGRPLHDKPRVDEGSDGGLEGDAETRPALLLRGEDRLSGDDGGGIAAAAASERPPSGGEDSSRSSGSLLDAGGGGVDGDDDDGYF
ncbi:unnamed protein product [Scytosiphon promiscuus]